MDKSNGAVRLLIVDDNQMLCDILRSYFELTKEVELCGIAHDGGEAIQKIEELEPDIVLLDIIMPQLDGISVLEHLSRVPYAKKPRVIVASAIGQENVTNRALGLGADYYMIKPYQLPDLLNRVLLVSKQGGETELPGAAVRGRGESGSVLPAARISEMLIEEGMPTNVVGYQYCVEAIGILSASKKHCPLGKHVYAVIAERNDTTVSCVESAIRKAVSRTMQGKEGQLTNGGFLTMMTEKLRLRSTYRNEEE